MLAAVSDVFVENYLPGKLAEMGLGYEDIKKIAPHIVYCSITGYGQTGPMVQRGGYDSIAAAVSGLMHITGHEDGEPVRPGVAMTDLATGLYTYGAIMAGLLQRYKTGKGLHIDCNLLSSQVACLTHVAANYLNCKIEAKRWGTAHGSIVPYQAFKTKDGYIVVGAGNDQQFVTVCKILNLPEVSKDSRYKTNALRVQNRKELTDILSTRFSEKTTIEWLQLFEGSGVPYGPINNMQQVFSDPQVLHNGLVMEMNHPTAGRIAVPGPGVRYSEFAVSHPKPPPLVGQHTVEILKGMLGYDDDAIEELLRTGAVAQHEILFLVSLPRDLPMHLEIPAWLSAMGTLELTFKREDRRRRGEERRGEERRGEGREEKRREKREERREEKREERRREEKRGEERRREEKRGEERRREEKRGEEKRREEREKRREEKRREEKRKEPWNTEKNLAYVKELCLIILLALIAVHSIKAVVNDHSHEKAESTGSDLG
ncbi:succinate--hydroxymethylglutarate CoA-transferase [Grus japonensis]|uniref:Succinate--hydroxymethylglutarate CoA-transferase n=1 Tax=Grus japonensis TaxID=30415 RepID=A0ABC9WFX6_GRUJA